MQITSLIIFGLVSYYFLTISMNLILRYKKNEWESNLIEGKQYLFLKQTILCSDCDCIFSFKDFIKCPSCGNTNSFHLSKTFNLPKNPIKISKDMEFI